MQIYPVPPAPANCKPCKHCNAPFIFKSAKALFCSDAHKKAWSRARNKNLQAKRQYRFETSAFTFFLADSCRRSGTVQILPQTLEELQDLHAVYKYALRANGYGESDGFSLCHIFPVKHHFFIGTLCAQNLVVADRELNGIHSNSFTLGAGTKISRMELRAKWFVAETEGKATTVKKIIEYLGGVEFTTTVAVRLKLQPTTRQAVLDWLLAAPASPLIPSQTVLAEMTTKALSQLKGEVSNKGTSYMPASYELTQTEVFLHEVNRLAAYRPELETVVAATHAAFSSLFALSIDVQLARPCAYGGSPAAYTAAREALAPITKAQFDLLHGGEVGTFLDTLCSFFSGSEAPIQANIGTMQTATALVLPTAPKTVPILLEESPAVQEAIPRGASNKPKRSFAEELDAEIRLEELLLEMGTPPIWAVADNRIYTDVPEWNR
ncbi:MAG: hypothetical protein ACOH2I_11525 [Pseudomonas sp.]